MGMAARNDEPTRSVTAKGGKGGAVVGPGVTLDMPRRLVAQVNHDAQLQGNATAQPVAGGVRIVAIRRLACLVVKRQGGLPCPLCSSAAAFKRPSRNISSRSRPGSGFRNATEGLSHQRKASPKAFRRTNSAGGTLVASIPISTARQGWLKPDNFLA